MSSLRDLLKEKCRLKVVQVEIANVGSLYLRMPSSYVRKDFFERLGKDKKLGGSILADTICEEDGKLVYTHDDIDELVNWDWKIVDDIIAEIAKLMGIDEASIEAAKKKSLETTCSDGNSKPPETAESA